MTAGRLAFSPIAPASSGRQPWHRAMGGIRCGQGSSCAIMGSKIATGMETARVEAIVVMTMLMLMVMAVAMSMATVLLAMAVLAMGHCCYLMNG